MIRRAVADDIPRLVEMARDSYAQTPMAVFPFSAERTAEYMGALMSEANSCIYMSKGATIGTAIVCSPFSLAPIVTEEFWYADKSVKDARGAMALLAQVEKWAAQRQAAAVFMKTVNVPGQERVAKLYQRRGYIPLENTYMRVL